MRSWGTPNHESGYWTPKAPRSQRDSADTLGNVMKLDPVTLEILNNKVVAIAEVAERVIVKRVDERTRSKISINDLLRE